MKLKEVESSSIIAKMQEEKQDLSTHIKKTTKERNMHEKNCDSIEKDNDVKFQRKDRVVNRLSEDKKKMMNNVAYLKNSMSSLNKTCNNKEKENNKLKEKKKISKKELRKNNKKVNQLRQIINNKKETFA